MTHLALYDLRYLIDHYQERDGTRINHATRGVSATKMKTLNKCKELGFIEFMENFGEQSRLTDSGVELLKFCLVEINAWVAE